MQLQAISENETAKETVENLEAGTEITNAEVPESIDTRRIPDLAKAAIILFVVNLVVLAWFYLSPSFKPRLSEAQISDTAQSAIQADRLSPFTPTVDDTKVPVRTAARMRPILTERPVPPPVPESNEVPAAEQSASAADHSQVPAYTSPYVPVAYR